MATPANVNKTPYVPYVANDAVQQPIHDQALQDWNQNAQRTSQMRVLMGGVARKYLSKQYNKQMRSKTSRSQRSKQSKRSQRSKRTQRSKTNKRRTMRGGGRTLDIPAPAVPFQMPSHTANNGWTVGEPCVGVHCGVPVTPFVADYARAFGASSLQPYVAMDRLGNSPAELMRGGSKKRRPSHKKRSRR